MRLLVAGVLGQLGRGVAEVAASNAAEIVGLARARAGRSASDRVERAFRAPLQIPVRTVEGDVTQPMWGLEPETLAALAGEIDGVLNLAAETNWASPARRHHAVNVMGAVHGLDLANALRARGGRCRLYCYASTVHVAGHCTGRIPEEPMPSDGTRTAYEHSKWLAERALLDPSRGSDGLQVAIARIGGLVGNSATGATAQRNSLYLLLDRWEAMPGRVLPVAARGRVDMLPRDIAGDLLLRASRGLAGSSDTCPAIVHVCAGEQAPTIDTLIGTLRSLDGWGSVAPPRLVHVSDRVLLGVARRLEAVTPMSATWRNALIGLRYLSLDRVFERSRLAGAVAGPLPVPSVELLARLAFEVPDLGAFPSRGTSSLARFAR
jgi:nucleoside-diphosphate-sugar epimerase